MDITPQDNTATQPISDDQELAKALAGVLPDEPAAAPASGLQFEETPAAPAVAPTAVTPPVDEAVTTAIDTLPEPAPVVAPSPSAGLESIKNEALNELRPLIDHVDLPAEEKFDTYLMLIRSTDDASLIAPAHVAAQGITDEKRKAEALLEIIKEIDYLSRKDQQPAA
jgi:hypothetical protein